MNRIKVLIIAVLAALMTQPILGVDSTFWQVGSFEEFLRGKLAGVELNKAGEVSLAPDAKTIFSPEEALALSVAADKNHNIYVGTGHQGKVFRVEPNHKSSLWFTASEPDIFALAVGPDGSLYVGSSPEGKIYRVSPEGKSHVFYDPASKYIWALVFDSKGNLYAGTGDKGQIFKIDPSGKSSVFFDSTQTHIMCLTMEKDGSLLAGSAPDGLVYRISPESKPFVLYESSLPEIHAIETDASGSIFVAALGTASGKGTQELFLPPSTGLGTPTAVTTVTVTASTEESANEEDKKRQTPPAQTHAPSFNRPGPTQLGLPSMNFPSGKGSLIEIKPDYSAETIWSSNNESIFGLALRGKMLLFSTDQDGRVFQLDPSADGERMTLLAETHESLATRLLLEGGDLYVATSNVAKLFRLGGGLSREGSYESQVKDTKFVSKWGTLAWRGRVPGGTSIEFYARAGNSDRPDNTWTDWTGPYSDSDGTHLHLTPARYMQWKSVFKTSNNSSPSLDDVTVSYVNQNLPPDIRSLIVSTSGERTSPNGGGSISPGSMGQGITVSAGGNMTFGPPQGTLNLKGKAPITISWQADDPNGDQLVYSLYVRSTDEQEWHLLKDKIHTPSFALEPDTLADGKYIAKLVASDKEDNPPSTARESELESAPFWIDNTPPAVKVTDQKLLGNHAQVSFLAEDSTSPLRDAEVSEDGKPWQDIFSDDGVVDSRRETFTYRTGELKPGEHIIALRAYDTSGNIGIGKAVIQVGNTGAGQ
jgi:hypothetical protein